MNKVAFYLNNPSMPDRDYSNIIDSNPGMPGSEYEFLLVPYLLEQRDNDIEPYVCVNFTGKFPHKNVVNCTDLKAACEYCIKENICIIVVDIKYFDDRTLNHYADSLDVFVWAHNDVSAKLLNKFTTLDYVKKIVNCGREELELYRDHIATLKSTYIYNIFPFKDKELYLSKIKNRDNHNVVFLGSITKEKGFHILARAWKNVLKKVPDANLYVIGSGKLYDRNAKLGKYNIASEDYEKAFIHYIVDENGELLPSVHFLGLLADDKYDILGSCKVGVPNPTGFSECLPITTIEMQLMGCSLTTLQHPAYYDTVYNKKYLYTNETHLADYIVKRLLSPVDDWEGVYDYVTSRFGIEDNIVRWENIIKNPGAITLEPISEFHIENKKLKDHILSVKQKFSFFKRMPTLRTVFTINQILKLKIGILWCSKKL